ncbi:MAG: hypothetical protein IJ728_03475 [Selenomonadaceae bacterium]|nr:hypothetical protein [Selenomonadaceae bacterium]
MIIEKKNFIRVDDRRWKLSTKLIQKIFSIKFDLSTITTKIIDKICRMKYYNL